MHTSKQRARQKSALLALPACAALLVCACAEEDPEPAFETQTRTAVVDDDLPPPGGEPQGLRARGEVERAERGQPPLARAGGTVPGSAGPFEAIRVEHRVPDQVRVGEPHPFTLVVANTTSEPLRGVAVRHVGGDEYEILEIGQDSQRLAQQQGNQQQQGRQTAQQQKSQQQSAQQQGAQQQGLQTAQQQGSPRQGTPIEASARRQGDDGRSHQQGLAAGRTFHIGTLQPNESRTIQGRAVANREGRIETCLAVEFQPVVCSTIEAVQPELRLARRVDEERYYVCEEIPLVYAVANTGSGESAAVTLQHALPEGLRTAEGEDRVLLDLGPIEAGETVERTVRLQAQRGGEFTLGQELQLDDSSVRAQEVTFVVLEPQLELTIDGPPKEYLGRTLTYQVSVRNTSDVPALETAVKVEMPQQAARPTVSSRALGEAQEQGVFRIGELDPGQTRSFALRFEPTSIEQVRLQATAEALCAEAVQDEITTEVVGIPAILLEVVDRNDPVAVGETTVYEIRVKNQGTAPGLDIRVQAELPEEMEFVSGDGTTQVQSQGRQIRFGPVERVEPGDVVGWNVEVRATGEAMARFRVELQSEAQAQPVFELEPTTLFGEGQPGVQGGQQQGQEGRDY